jgi:hypothetical protein
MMIESRVTRHKKKKRFQKSARIYAAHRNESYIVAVVAIQLTVYIYRWYNSSSLHRKEPTTIKLAK